MEHQELPFISVAIPALNEEKYIEATLKSLSHQTYPKDRFEILVVLSTATTDHTADIAKKYGARVVMEKPGIGRARWRGFKEAKGEILAGTDSDTVVPSHWLMEIAKVFLNPNVVSVTGPVYPQTDAALNQRFAFWLGTGVYKTVSFVQQKAYMSGMNYAVRRSAYEKSGGFDPEIKSGEDTNLTDKMAKVGKTVFDSKLYVYTSTRRLKEGYVRSFMRYSKNFVLLKLGKRPPGFPHYR